MLAIAQLMDSAKKSAGIKSDLQLAKSLGVSQGAVWQWRNKTSIPNIEHAHELAELAGLDPAKVVTEILIRGSHSPALIKTLERFKSVSLASLVTAVQCILC